MTATNNQVANGAIALLHAADLGYPIAYKNVDFEPPASGIWLQLTHFPNTGIAQGIASGTVIPQGLWQIEVCGRKGGGADPLELVADQVKAAYPKNTVLAGLVRVSRTPYSGDINEQDDRAYVVVTVPYSG